MRTRRPKSSKTTTERDSSDVDGHTLDIELIICAAVSGNYWRRRDSQTVILIYIWLKYN